MTSGIYFEIQADNPIRAMEFYREIFGWKFLKGTSQTTEYWRIEFQGQGGGLLKRPAPAPAPEQGTNAFVCSFMVEKFDDMARAITENGGKVALPKFAVPGVCWQGYFLDTEGNTFGIFQPDQHAR